MGSGYFGGIHFGQYAQFGIVPPSVPFPLAVEAHNVHVGVPTGTLGDVSFARASNVTVTYADGRVISITPDE